MFKKYISLDIFAQAGGKDGSKVMEALESVKKSIREKL